MFISMQNINFITQFFLEVLQRNYMLVILSTLGLPGQNHNKWCSLHKKSTLSLTFFLRYCKDLTDLLFWVIWAGLAIPNKINGINLYDSLMFIYMPTSSLPSFLRYFKDITNLLIWILWEIEINNGSNYTEKWINQFTNNDTKVTKRKS